jgi:subtilisin-like proprotein convertase family protein
MSVNIPGNSSTTVTLIINTSVSGSLDFFGDTDWRRVSLTAGYGYQFSLEGFYAGLGSLFDPYLAIYSPTGTFVASNDDRNISTRDSYYYFAPPSSGIYFLSAEEFGNNGTGTYVITALLDQLASTATAASISVNGMVTDRIGWADDSDWYAIALTAGVVYQFDAAGSNRDGATLALTDPFLILWDAAGAIVGFDNDSGVGGNARIFFTPTTSGTYYLDIQESGRNASGVYTLVANATPITGSLQFDSPRVGSIDFEGDVDLFSVALTAGVSYGFSITGGTLIDPFLELLDASGAEIVTDDDSGPFLDSQLVFVPTTSGTYYLLARAANYASQGSYTAHAWELPKISIEDASILEGNTSTKPLNFLISLSKASPVDVTVTVGTRAGTASSASVDYYGIPETVVTIPAGQTSVVFSVPVVGDTEFEPNEGFSVFLSNPVMATISNASARGWIFDDDAPYTLPSDPFSRYQWHLYPGVGVNVFPVWDSWDGSGVRVAVFDQGIDPTHADLDNNLLIELGRQASNMTLGGDPLLASDNHGTPVAGVIAAEANGLGVIGVAPKASLVSIYSTLSYSSLATDITNAFSYAKNFDILNNSWGFGNLSTFGSNVAWAFYDNFLSASFSAAGHSLRQLAESGRNGLGTIVVQSAGNSYGFGDDTNLHNFQNSRYIITVAATDYYGTVTGYSSPGASVLIAAPGGERNINNDSLSEIYTTDRVGSAGYHPGDYTFIQGTSFSGPIISGVVALMLEANPTLGYRDVQQIIAYSGRRIADGENSWAYNGASNWNGGGLHFDSATHNLGFGLIDALTAVRLAESWSTGPLTSANDAEYSVSLTLQQAIPDGASLLQQSLNVTEFIEVERVEVTIDISHSWIGDLSIILTSPSGTNSWLLSRPGQSSSNPYGQNQDNISFTFNTVLSMGESSVGDWRLSIFDQALGDVGTLNSWTLNLIGKPISDRNVYVYTDEYKESVTEQSFRATLVDSGGVDEINAAAVTSATILNLQDGSQSMIDGQLLSISVGSIVENAVGGDGNDYIAGNAVTNILRGMRGNDSLNGGDGNDTLHGGEGSDTFDWDPVQRYGDDLFFGGLGNDIYVVNSIADSIIEFQNEGADTVWANISYSLPINVEILRLYGSQNINALGSVLSDTIFGNIGNNILEGGDGNDTLIGGDGNDLLSGGAGDDIINGGADDGTIDSILDTDTAIYQGNRTDYIVSFDTGNSIYTLISLNEGVDKVSSVEKFIFADRTLLATQLINNSPAGSVTLSGAATQGQTLTASNDLTDADGIPASGAGAISYQWKANGTPIAGATGGSYTLTQAEVGQTITVTASYTDGSGNPESVTSLATSPVAGLPTYTLNTDLISVDEGGVLTITVSTSNVASGAQLNYVLTGAGITGGDISGAQLSGFSIVDSAGVAKIIVGIAPDQLSEGIETLTVDVMGASVNVQVIDTSQRIQVSRSQPVSLSEGAEGIIYISLGKPAPAGGLVINYQINGSANAADFLLTAEASVTHLTHNSLTIAEGAKTAALKVLPLLDGFGESVEKFSFNIIPGDGYLFTEFNINSFPFAGNYLIPSGDGNSNLVSGDFNGDGNLDLVSVNPDKNSVSTQMGSGDGNFYKDVRTALWSQPFSASIGDFNGDGYDDLAATQESTSLIAVMLGGPLGLNSSVYYSAPYLSRHLTVSDIDNDGKQDIITASLSGTINILKGVGDGTFSLNSSLTVGSQANLRQLAVVDTNLDGFKDIIVADWNANELIVLLGGSTGAFESQVTYKTNGINPEGLGVGDFNGDNIADVVVANYGSASVSIILGDGGGGFEIAKTFGSVISPRQVAVADYDVDGILDFVVTGDLSNLSVVYKGDGAGNFTLFTTIEAPSVGYGVATGDFNEDGLPDIALGSRFYNFAHLAVSSSNATQITETLNYPEFRVNSFTQNHQTESTVAALSDGGWVVAWMSTGQDGSSGGIYGQRYSSRGVPIGAEFLINTYFLDLQISPSIAALSDGGWVVTWDSYQQDGSYYGVYGQRFGFDGVKIGDEFRVNTYVDESQLSSSVTGLPSGGWVVVWNSGGQDGSSGGIFGQRYGSSGSLLGGEFLVNSSTLYEQFYPSISALSDGGWVVVWGSPDPLGLSAEIYGQRFNAEGQPVGHEFLVNTYTLTTQAQPIVAGLHDGGWVVIWTSAFQDGSDMGVYGQRFSATGLPLGDEFKVNTTVIGAQFQPAITALQDGGWVVTWTGQDDEFAGIVGQRYGANGEAVGSEFRVNSYTRSGQSDPSLSALADGGWIVTWASDTQDGDGGGVYGQRFNSNGEKFGRLLEKTSSSVTEGEQVTFKVLTTNMAADTAITYFLSGPGLSEADIVGGQLSGTTVVGIDGIASFNVQLAVDFRIEGIETLNVSVLGQSTSVIVNDLNLSALEIRPVSFRNGVATFEVWLKPGASVEAGDLVLSHALAQGSFKAGSLVAAAGVTAVENAQLGSTAVSFFSAAPVGGATATKLLSFSYDAAPGVRQFDAGLSAASLTFAGQVNGVDVALPPPAIVTALVDLTGITYHWKSHALLGGVTVSAQGGEASTQGAQAPIQLKNLTWDAAGQATVEVWAQAATASQNVGFELNLGTGAQAQFTQDAALNSWTVVGNAQPTGYALAAFTADANTALAAGSYRLGTLSFSTGVAPQAQIGLVTGEVGTVTSTPYAINLARTVTDVAGSYTLTELDPGAYALQASRATTDSGNAITSADALAALRIAVGLNPNATLNGVQPLLSPYQIMAADVVGTDGRITSADALGILRMAVKLPTAPAAEWLFVEETRDFWNEAANNGQGAFTLTRTAALWDKAIATTLQDNGEVNLVGVLKGDVNGTWAAPAGSQDLDVIDPLYFQSLSSLIGAPLDQWAVL